MASGIVETKKPQLQIKYEKPWGGIASNAAPSDIDPSQCVTMDGLTIRNGLLCYTTIASQNSQWDLELITPTNIAPGGGTGTGTTAIDSIETNTTNGQTGHDLVTTSIKITFTAPVTCLAGQMTVTGSSLSAANRNYSIPALTGAISYILIFTYEGLFLSSGGTATYPISGAGVPQDWPGAYICLIFNAGNYLCAVDQYGFSYIATVQMDGTIKFQFDQIATNGPTTAFGIPTAVKVVNGVAYISVYSTHTLYAYTPGVSYAVASTITAGQIIDIFDEYMLQLNTNTGAFSSGGTPLGEQLCAVNWSGPDEFSTWDPSLDRTSGYQVLTSVEDFISGFIAVDNVGYIFKRTGVTQMTATGVAIQPWTFTTYWNSTIGQGLIFPGTLKQFGRFVFLGTDSGLYQFYGGQFSPIDENSRAAIFNSFNQNPPLNAQQNSLITAGLSIYPFNDKTPIPEYIFTAITTSISGDIIFWFYQPNSKTWTSVTRSVADLLTEYVEGATNIVVNSIQTASVFLNALQAGVLVNISNLPTCIFYINFSYTDSASVNHTQTYIYYELVQSPTSDTTDIDLPAGTLNLVFRQEEIQLGYTRKPTIRRVIIKALGSGTLNFNITAQDGSQISLGSITLDGTKQMKTYYSPRGIATVEAPQFSITSNNWNGIIQKVLLAGTYADGDID